MREAGSGKGISAAVPGASLAIGDLNTHLLGNEERKITQASNDPHRSSQTRPVQSTMPLTSGTSGRSQCPDDGCKEQEQEARISREELGWRGRIACILLAVVLPIAAAILSLRSLHGSRPIGSRKSPVCVRGAGGGLVPTGQEHQVRFATDLA